MSHPDLSAVEGLERAVAGWLGLDPGHVVACSSGTAALHLALETVCGQGLTGQQAASVREGCLCPDLTMYACPRAIELAGMRPVFTRVRPDDLLVDLDDLDRAASEDPRVAAVMVVHLYGRTVDMGAAQALAHKHCLAVVEDLAEAHGVAPHPETDAACWSFYRNKVVGGQEGGAVWFKDAGDAAVARRLRNLGFTDDHDFWHHPGGHNYRLADLLVPPIRWSLEGFGRSVEVRRESEARYEELCPAGWRLPPRASPWVYDLRVPGISSEAQGRAVRALVAAGIAARHCFKPCSRQVGFGGFGLVPAALEHGETDADRLSREVLYLPLVGPANTPLPIGTHVRAFETLLANVPVFHPS